MNEKSFEQQNEQSPAPQASNIPAQSRRRNVLLGGGVGAILATVKSGSALAGGICVAPSAFSSIKANSTTSNKPKSFGACSSRVYYGNNGGGVDLDARWSPVIRSTATLRNVGFSGGPWPLTTKLYDIIKAGSSLWLPDGNLIVIYLDVMTGKAGGVLTEGDVKDMWSILFGTGTTNPKFAGWDAQKVRDFYSVWVGDTQL